MALRLYYLYFTLHKDMETMTPLTPLTMRVVCESALSRFQSGLIGGDKRRSWRSSTPALSKLLRKRKGVSAHHWSCAVFPAALPTPSPVSSCHSKDICFIDLQLYFFLYCYDTFIILPTPAGCCRSLALCSHTISNRNFPASFLLYD